MEPIQEANQFTIVINDRIHTVDTSTISASTTLNEYIRDHLHLTGTKYMCREGGCGVCLVAVTTRNPTTGAKETIAVNSCLVSILSCAGWEIRTVEGVGNRRDGYSPIQQKIVQFNGTQCGFCTPGMVVNMHCLQEAGKTTMAEIENSFGGNICRCTGYRPILAAFKSMATDADQAVLGTIPDIEELEMCKKEKCTRSCPMPCQKLDAPLIYDIKPVKNWYKAFAVQDIFQIFALNPNASYNLVAGNTAKGVYRDMNKVDYYIDVNAVPELRSFRYDKQANKLVLGGNVTIAEMMVYFTQEANNNAEFRHLQTVVDHLDLVATVAIRNVGTIAGNLSIKHVHNEFPSDLFVLLQAINAKIIIDDGTIKTVHSPSAYLKLNVIKKIITAIEIPPLDASYKFQSYKIMPRAQNAHAYVNAAFLFKLDAENIVETATIIYGGINPPFVHATAAEKFIIGKQLFKNENIQLIFDELNREIIPDHVLPDPPPEYRKHLAIALLYKAILSMAPSDMVSELYKSGAEKLIRPPVSTAVQDFQTNTSLYPIGKPVEKYEAAAQASGETKYITDMPNQPGQLFAAFVLAKAPTGSIVQNIDVNPALAMESVTAFYQASDIADLNGRNTFIIPGLNDMLEEEKIFVGLNEKVQYYYQPLGIIIATEQRLAEIAAEAVQVKYSTPESSPLLTVREVLASTQTHRVVLDETIPAAAQDPNVPHQFTGQFDISWQYHYHMETQTVNIVPDDDGGYIIHPSTQWIDAVQGGIHGAFKVPANKMSIFVKRLGGSYGAKITRNNWLACAAMLAAIKLGRPVKFWLPFTTNMNVIGCRHPTSLDYEIGVDATGRIGYLNSTVYSDMGIHINDLPKHKVVDLMLNTYNPQPIRIDYHYVRTDNHAATWTRAPGSVEGQAMMEVIMEHIAYKLDMDPVDVRLANLNIAQHPLLGELFRQFLVWSDFRARRSEIEEFNKKNRWRKRGMGISTMAYNIGFISDYHGLVSIYHHDGSVVFTHGGVEMGQGVNTKARQVVAYTLGIAMAQVAVRPTNNISSPNNYCTGGSQTNEAVCFALEKSCKALKQRIDAAAIEANLATDATWFEKIENAFKQGVNLCENALIDKSVESLSPYTIYGVTATEVEVDILTGSMIVQRVDLLEDVGDSMSPLIDIGQVEGAFVMGLGYWTTEQTIMDRLGRKMTNRTWNYKPPGCKDIPVDFRVKFPEGIPNPLSPYKTKATAEPPMCMTVSVALAIRHAIKTARIASEADPWVPMNGPCTVDWIFLNSLTDYKQFKM